ncbi:MAG: response regulator transcription factor [Ignavibacteriales bacterium]|nr:response regulator transcription factor [Ignavibacteriales bacterium]
MRKTRIKILLVDDHPLMLSGMAAFLKGKKRIAIVGRAANGTEAIPKAKQSVPDIILMDIGLPKMSGLDTLRVLRQEIPTAKVLIYTMHENAEYMEAARRFGARGYILKSSSPKELARAISAIHAGEVFVSSRFSHRIQNGDGNNTVSHDHAEPKSRSTSFLGEQLTQQPSENYKLTAREQEILLLITEGSTMHQIAQKLDLSYNTMTTHFKHIYQKINVHNRGSAVAKAIREHIV